VSVRRSLAAHLAAQLGEAVTVVATSHRADLTPPWVTVDNAEGSAEAAVFTATLEVQVAVASGGDALTYTDALEDLVTDVLDAIAGFGDVDVAGFDAPDQLTGDRHPLLAQTIRVAHAFRICPTPTP
jgi:hypothetical protein